MGAVVDLPKAPGPPPASVNALRLRSAGHSFETLFTVFFALGVAGVAGMVIQMVADGGQVMKVGPMAFALPAGRAHLILTHAPLGERCLYALLALVRSAPLLAVLWTLRNLFGLFAKGVVFSQGVADAVRAVGVWLIVDAAAGQAWQAILMRRLVVESRMESLWEPVLGGVVIAIALVMRAGREIEDAGEGFV